MTARQRVPHHERSVPYSSLQPLLLHGFPRVRTFPLALPCCFGSCSPFQTLLFFVPNPYFLIASAFQHLGPRRSLPLCFQHSSSVCHIPTASSTQPPSPPTPHRTSPHLLNPFFPVLIRCCLPTQRKAGRSTALPKIARGVVYAQWWHLNRRCARVMPGQSS